MNTLCLKNFPALIIFCKRNNKLLKPVTLHTTCVQRRNFIGFVPDRKDGYKTLKDEPKREHIKYGLKQFKNELKLWTEEMKETLRADPLMICPPGSFLFIIHFMSIY